jgi:hypothetical protein
MIKIRRNPPFRWTESGGISSNSSSL